MYLASSISEASSSHGIGKSVAHHFPDFGIGQTGDHLRHREAVGGREETFKIDFQLVELLFVEHIAVKTGLVGVLFETDQERQLAKSRLIDSIGNLHARKFFHISFVVEINVHIGVGVAGVVRHRGAGAEKQSQTEKQYGKNCFFHNNKSPVKLKISGGLFRRNSCHAANLRVCSSQYIP